MSELKRYLDRLANGPLLDSATSVGPYLRDEDAADETPVKGGELAKKRLSIRNGYLNRAPLRARRKRKP